MTQIERTTPLAGRLQLRSTGADGHLATFEGYASTVGKPYPVTDWLGQYEETIDPGAFRSALRSGVDVPLLVNHTGIPLASTASRTSRLSEDHVGLRNEADLDKRSPQTLDVCTQLERGVLNAMSFSFGEAKDRWNAAKTSRNVTDLKLFDTSVVTRPANATTSAALRADLQKALGREGRGLWVGYDRGSIRSALPMLRSNPDAADPDDLEQAITALRAADEALTRSRPEYGRARTGLIAGALIEVRAGRALSAANEALIQQAVDALNAGQQQHGKLMDHHAKASGNLQTVLDASHAEATSQDGISDGAGPRSASLALASQREAELHALRNRVARDEIAPSTGKLSALAGLPLKPDGVELDRWQYDPVCRHALSQVEYALKLSHNGSFEVRYRALGDEVYGLLVAGLEREPDELARLTSRLRQDLRPLANAVESFDRRDARLRVASSRGKVA